MSASYRLPHLRTEVPAVSLTGEELPAQGEHWTDEVIWTYQVVETGLIPDANDPLYEYAQGRKNRAHSLSVIRAHVDPSLNGSVTEISGDAPVLYLVFREDRGRLAAIISFSDKDGHRTEKAWRTRELQRSWSVLSQSMMTPLPTYLPPHGVRLENRVRRLENGSVMHTTVAGEDAVEVTFSDEFGGGNVAMHIDFDAPWPTWLITMDLKAVLLDDDTVRETRSTTGLLPAPPQDQDYRAALAVAIDLDAALLLDTSMIDAHTQASAHESHLPWNGSWWPQSKGSLVFGYDDQDTISDRIREEIDPIRVKMDGYNEELQALSQSDERYDEVVALYLEQQRALVDALVSFYDGVRDDLDAGRLTYRGGTLSHVDGWSYDLDTLSPMDKVALGFYDMGESSYNPFYVPAWELLNHYSPEGGSWWGHCNGWSAAAILMDEPIGDEKVSIGEDEVTFTSADLKGLLTESHYSTYSRFYGDRYYGEGDDPSDLSPAAFHRLVSFYIIDQQVPLVFDTDAGEQVWNFPAYGLDLDMVETTAPGAARMNLNTADVDRLSELPGIGEARAEAIVDYRETWGAFQNTEEVQEVHGIGPVTWSGIEGLVTVDPVRRSFDVTAVVSFATDGVPETHVDDGHPATHGFSKTWSYELITNEGGVVIDGTWEEDSEHPDFAWVPFDNPVYASGDSSENPFMAYETLRQLIGDDLERR